MEADGAGVYVAAGADADCRLTGDVNGVWTPAADTGSGSFCIILIIRLRSPNRQSDRIHVRHREPGWKGEDGIGERKDEDRDMRVALSLADRVCLT